MRTDSRVDEYIGQLPGWQQAICQQVRGLVHDADPEVENVFIYDPTVADPDGIINQGHGNATARAVQIYQDDSINGHALVTMFQAVIANNRAGGWRHIEASPPD